MESFCLRGVHLMAEVHDRIDWWMFVCSGCGEETFVGKSPGQTLEEFGLVSLMLYGDPPVCSGCQAEQREAC
jgi:hypothetical protein